MTHYKLLKQAFWDEQSKLGKAITLIVFPKWLVIGLIGWIYILK